MKNEESPPGALTPVARVFATRWSGFPNEILLEIHCLDHANFPRSTTRSLSKCRLSVIKKFERVMRSLLKRQDFHKTMFLQTTVPNHGAGLFIYSSGSSFY
jgi:hypothetical protein